MESVEWCWSLVYFVIGIISLVIEGSLFSFFVKPFLSKPQSAYLSGTVYAVLMVILYVLPMEVEYPRIIGSCAVFGVLGVLDGRNMAQKSVLLVVRIVSEHDGIFCFCLFVRCIFK